MKVHNGSQIEESSDSCERTIIREGLKQPNVYAWDNSEVSSGPGRGLLKEWYFQASHKPMSCCVTDLMKEAVGERLSKD